MAFNETPLCGNCQTPLVGVLCSNCNQSRRRLGGRCEHEWEAEALAAVTVIQQSRE